MAKLMKQFLAAAALLAVPLLSHHVHADTIRIETLACLQTQERGGLDRIRLRYRVDGGRRQELRRNMRHGDVWNVGTEIAFARELRIEIVEYDRTIFNKDEKLGLIIIRAGEIGDGQAATYAMKRHGAHYWASVGNGKYVAPKLPPPDKPRPPKEVWLDGGTYSTPDNASAAGVRLVTDGIATKFRVIEGVDLGLNVRVWRLQYVPKPKD